MTTIELKDILFHKIAAIDDKPFLEAIKTIIDTKSETIIYKLTLEQKERIKSSQEQIARGEHFIATNLIKIPNDFIKIAQNLARTWQQTKTTYHVFEISGSFSFCSGRA